jgi:signal transduction histidine kinase
VDVPVLSWGEYVVEDHRRDVASFWSRIFTSELPTQTAEWQFTNGRWVTVQIIRLDKAAPGLKGILGCVTDITERKLNEESQRLRVIEAEERRLEAEEAKRQQELLIDITSHEIRNPISSLMQVSHIKLMLGTQLTRVR